MHIVLATGIYPPDIGGPATYVRALAEQLVNMGHEVTVMTYKSDKRIADSDKQQWIVIHVPKTGGPLLRWWRYSRVLQKYGKKSDVVYAFSSVSCGVPLLLSGLVSSRARRGMHRKKPRTFLRLGGDFFWERYSAMGGMKGLREWYESRNVAYSLCRCAASWILNHFDYIVFSTKFQEEIYEQCYKTLPEHGVVENAVPSFPTSPNPSLKRREGDSPSPIERGSGGEACNLLFLGRFVGFKNLLTLVHAVAELPSVQLTLVGDGPYKPKIEKLIQQLKIDDRIQLHPPVHGEKKLQMYAQHDYLIIPSTTEISPNTALEAVSSGLPVLLTRENGFSEQLQQGMVVQPLRTKEEIVTALQECMESDVPTMPKEDVVRGWEEVTSETVEVFDHYLYSHKMRIL